MNTQLKAADVAAYLVDKSETAIGWLHIQNLLYKIQGMHFGLQEKALFPDDFIASNHGAMIPDFYQKYIHQPSLWVQPDELGNKELLTDRISVFIVDTVFDRFITMSSCGLREIIKHEKIWKQAYKIAEDHVITQESMKEYYMEMIQIERARIELDKAE